MTATITIINTFFGCLSFVLVMRALYFSYLYGFKIRDRSITFLLTSDRVRFEKICRLALHALATLSLILVTHQVNRILEGFPLFISTWVMVTSLLVFLSLFVVCAVALLCYDDKLANFIFRKKP